MNGLRSQNICCGKVGMGWVVAKQVHIVTVFSLVLDFWRAYGQRLCDLCKDAKASLLLRQELSLAHSAYPSRSVQHWLALARVGAQVNSEWTKCLSTDF